MFKIQKKEIVAKLIALSMLIIIIHHPFRLLLLKTETMCFLLHTKGIPE